MGRSSTRTSMGVFINEGRSLLNEWMELNRRKKMLMEMWNEMDTHSNILEFQLSQTIKLIDEVKADIAKYNRFIGVAFFDEKGDE